MCVAVCSLATSLPGMAFATWSATGRTSGPARGLGQACGSIEGKELCSSAGRFHKGIKNQFSSLPLTSHLIKERKTCDVFGPDQDSACRRTSPDQGALERGAGAASKPTCRLFCSTGAQAAASLSYFSFSFTPQHVLLCQAVHPSPHAGKRSPRRPQTRQQQQGFFYYFDPKGKGVMETTLLRAARAEHSPAQLGRFSRDGPGSVHPTAAAKGDVDVGGQFLPTDKISPGSAEEQSFIPDIFQSLNGTLAAEDSEPRVGDVCTGFSVFSLIHQSRFHEASAGIQPLP